MFTILRAHENILIFPHSNHIAIAILHKNNNNVCIPLRQLWFRIIFDAIIFNVLYFFYSSVELGCDIFVLGFAVL